MKRAQSDSQLSLPPVEVPKPEGQRAAFRKTEEPDVAFRKAEDDGYRLASEFFDAALADLESRGQLHTKDVAFLCGVSESLVQKWRSVDERACPSFAQMLRLPPAFHLALHRAMNRKYGFGRAALVQLLEAAGALALVTE